VLNYMQSKYLCITTGNKNEAVHTGNEAVHTGNKAVHCNVGRTVLD